MHAWPPRLSAAAAAAAAYCYQGDRPNPGGGTIVVKEEAFSAAKWVKNVARY
jgi:hypothetical protein